MTLRPFNIQRKLPQKRAMTREEFEDAYERLTNEYRAAGDEARRRQIEEQLYALARQMDDATKREGP